LFAIFIKLYSNDPQGIAVEIFIGTENVSPVSKNIKITLDAIGQVWEDIDNGSDKVLILSNDNNYYSSSWLIAPNNEADPYHWDGWDFTTSQSAQGTYPVYGFGLYRFSTEDSSSYFYIDFRDDRFGSYGLCQPPSYGHDIDIWIKYNDSTDEFYISTQPSYIGWNGPISNGDILTIWDIKQKDIPNTAGFPSFWINALNLLKEGNNPILIWAPHPTMSNITSYKIYRSVTPYGGSPSRFYPYTLLATVDANTFEYTDYDFTMGGTSNTAYWQVKAYNGIESSPTNAVSTAVLYYDKNTTAQNVLDVQAGDSFKILGNSPNPFNAQTRISFILPQADEVSLKIYNIQGKIVNEQHAFKEPGLQSFLFDASQLSSGVYFYEIRSGRQRELKRLLLLK
jgi:Secretion system C-terminal sorting domain